MAAKNELLYLILQFLKEEGLTDAVHALERTTGLWFDAKHFEELVISGAWQAAEEYLLGFTGWEANGASLKMFFELRKQKYLEALDRWVAAQRHIARTAADVATMGRQDDIAFVCKHTRPGLQEGPRRGCDDPEVGPAHLPDAQQRDLPGADLAAGAERLQVSINLQTLFGTSSPCPHLSCD